jgi:16S rRNA (uracil1498-N3)-methyltransferase
VELGAAAIQPLVTERSAPMPAGERGDKRLAHWRGIVVAACEQCGRNRIPPVAAPVPWQAWVRQWNDAALVLAPGARAVLASLPRPASPVALAVGPEGGFSDRELEAALNAGLRAVSFGPRVLRTETAGVAALAAMQALWGDLR